MTNKQKILVGRKLPDAIEAKLSRDYLPLFNSDDHVFSPDELIAKSQGMDAILACHSEPLNAEVIALLPDTVRLIANFSVGVDHVDLNAAKARGIVVTNTPDVLSDATAEIAILCMLGAARRASEGERLVRSGHWNSWSPAFMVGTQITGKRIGIVGMGRVGQVLAQRASGFGMKIHYHNRRPLPSITGFNATFHPQLEEMLPLCDVLSLNCPATPETRGLLNRARIDLLPEGAIVVNTARGALVDDEALIAALKIGKVGAAGLDVFNDEPNLHPGYRELDNTFLLPHIGSATRETRDAMGYRALENIEAFFSGKEPVDRVA
ncbi:D-glycerate dehydrogenase [Limibacillus sp. MBR-115]|jgi:lactate dehydrogenase-like 2-hydroxyacid dehydrogenase|uniref:2-hydroxyacid dehydrogenase n=1 Tax=Limibacillus sp. MBR-115 TaxID=3156465 RepID=UPI003394F8BA